MFWERWLAAEMNRTLQVLGLLFLFLSFFVWACNQQPKKSPAVELADEAVRRIHEANDKYRTGDYQTAKPALLDLLAFLDKAGYAPNAPGMYRMDAFSTCVRLAKLEEKQGHEAEKAAYMKQAVARCEALGIRKCDEDSIRKEVDRQDALPK
jgi:hypothetical protein